MGDCMAGDSMDFYDADYESYGWTKERLEDLDLTWKDLEQADAIRDRIVQYLERYKWEYSIDEENGFIDTVYKSQDGKCYDMHLLIAPFLGGVCEVRTEYDRRIPKRAWGKVSDLLTIVTPHLLHTRFEFHPHMEGTLFARTYFILDEGLPSKKMLSEYLHRGGRIFRRLRFLYP